MKNKTNSRARIQSLRDWHYPCSQGQKSEKPHPSLVSWRIKPSGSPGCPGGCGQCLSRTRTRKHCERTRRGPTPTAETNTHSGKTPSGPPGGGGPSGWERKKFFLTTRPLEQQVLLPMESDRNEEKRKPPIHGGSCCLFLSYASSRLFVQCCFCNRLERGSIFAWNISIVFVAFIFLDLD